MIDLLKAEFYKLIRMKSFWLIVLCCVLTGNIMQLDHGIPSSIGEGVDASLYHIPLLYFFVFIFGALYLGTDFENRTISAYICAGHNRRTILFVKTMVLITAANIIIIAPLLVCAGINLFRFGMPVFSMIKVLKSILLLFIMITSMNILPLLFGVIFKDTGKTLAVPMLFYFAMIFLLNGSHWNFFARYLPIGQIRRLSLHEFSIAPRIIILQDVFLILLIYFVSQIIFIKSDLK